MSKPTFHDYFATAYRTGSDIWTHIPYHRAGLGMLPDLSQDSLVLDVGAGRGLWVLKLVNLGLRVIGIDYVQDIVDKANKTIKEEGIQGKARFMQGDVRDIPLTDQSFDMVTDVGLLQHLPNDDWSVYVKEVARVLKADGYFLNVSLSRKTTRFLDWTPDQSDDGYFEKFGLGYYFFTEQELDDIFSPYFVKIEQKIRYYDTRSDPEDGVALVFTLWQKK